MIAESPKISTALRTMAKPLKRGRACMNCRILKIKCDGVKPVCGPCRKHPKDDECEYTDGSGRSRTKDMQEKIKFLEARLYEYEHPEESTPSVTLHDPYSSYHESVSRSPPSLSMPEARPFDSSTPFSPASSSSSLPSNQQWRGFGNPECKSESVGSRVSSSSPHQHYTNSQFLGTKEPEIVVIQTLLDNFLPYCQEFGFFLEPDRFREAALLHLPFGHPSRPSPAVLSAVYLWGLHLSQTTKLPQQEQSHFSRALQHAATDPFRGHPDIILHTLQAEILLSYYLLRTGRFIEAKCHTATAVSLALGAGLHKIRSVHFNGLWTLGLSSDTSILLPPPRDNIGESERIRGFWAVLVLHKYIMVSLELPTNVCGILEAPGIQVDTPWPLDILEYLEGPLNRGNTIRNFFLEISEKENPGHSITALIAKATLLFHRSVYVGSQWNINPNMAPHEFNPYMQTFQTLHRLIEKFRSILQPLPSRSDLEQSRSASNRTLLIYALTDAATIKLHIYFSQTNPSSKQLCLVSARRIVACGGFNIRELGHLNPVVGTLLVTACHVFINELSRVRSSRNAWPANVDGEDELMEGLKAGMAALSALSEESAFTKYQLTKIQQAYSAI